MFTVKVDVSDAAKILEAHGLNKGGRVQEFFTSELMKKSDPYVPYAAGVLKDSARVSQDKCAIEYEGPYARFHWYGLLMVDPDTNSSFAPKYKNKVVKKPDTKLQYNDGLPNGLRGPRWVERCWINEKDNIIKSTEEFARK